MNGCETCGGYGDKHDSVAHDGEAVQFYEDFHLVLKASNDRRADDQEDDPVDLTEFLLARIAEDEEVAREATDGDHNWLVEDNTIGLWPDDREPADGYMSFPRRAHARHATWWSPTRVLAECEAKRRIVEHAEPDLIALSPGDDYALRLLALPYADHPDYDPAWRP